MMSSLNLQRTQDTKSTVSHDGSAYSIQNTSYTYSPLMELDVEDEKNPPQCYRELLKTSGTHPLLPS